MSAIGELVRASALQGALLGVALGDALGLPYEKLNPRRALRLYPEPLRPRLVGRRAWVSDDAEMALMTARVLAASGGEPGCFENLLAQELRIWLATLPAGVGLATARACLKLWLGMPPARSGVFSAGSAPAIRGLVLGTALAGQPQRWQVLCQSATRITHTDDRALHGTLVAAALAERATLGHRQPLLGDAILQALSQLPSLEGTALFRLILQAVESATRGEPTEQFVRSQGWSRGVSGFVYHTVPVALHAWLMHPASFAEALRAVIRCGGDTDTIGALLGGWMGSHLGEIAFPEEWLAGLKDPICSREPIIALSARVVSAIGKGTAVPVARPFYGLRLGRNLVFLLIVLMHGFRRLLPPY